MTKIQIIKKMKCSSGKRPNQCSDIIVNKLQNELSCKLKAENKTDTVHGSVGIVHTDNNHIINIVFYDKDESSNAEHLTTLKKLGKIPSQSEIKKII